MCLVLTDVDEAAGVLNWTTEQFVVSYSEQINVRCVCYELKEGV